MKSPAAEPLPVQPSTGKPLTDQPGVDRPAATRAAEEKPRGRFVAGASCPACGAQDRVKVDVDTGLRRWCVTCDFDETLSPDGELPDTDPRLTPMPVRIFARDSDEANREASFEPSRETK